MKKAAPRTTLALEPMGEPARAGGGGLGTGLPGRPRVR